MESGELEFDPPEEEGRAPLSYVAAVGNALLVRLFLTKANVHATRLDRLLWSPLSYSAAAELKTKFCWPGRE
jgi:hypothetical protein